ncbi:unnamed protein product [Leuciscus chuanchicus]
MPNTAVKLESVAIIQLGFSIPISHRKPKAQWAHPFCCSEARPTLYLTGLNLLKVPTKKVLSAAESQRTRRVRLTRHPLRHFEPRAVQVTATLRSAGLFDVMKILGALSCSCLWETGL